MKKIDLSVLAQTPFSIQKLSQCMATFFTQITDICIKQLTERLQPKKAVETPISLSILAKNEESQSSGHEPSDKKTEGQKKKRKRISQTKPQFLQMKPKAPTSSYLIYLHSAKNDISAKYNITNVAELTKLVSLEWKKLPEAQKEKYSAKSQVQKQRYKEQMQIYREKYAAEIKNYKKTKQMRYKNNWIQNKKKKNEGESTQKRLKIEKMKKKLKFDSQILSQEDLLSESSYEKTKDQEKTVQNILANLN